MNIEKTGLVVVDAQNGFVTRHSQHVTQPIAHLVRRWHALGGTSVFTRFMNAPDSLFEQLIHWTRLRSAEETALHADVAPLATHVFDKSGYSFFTEEGERLVQANGWRQLIFCGIATESCVLKSAVDAFERGIVPWVVKDACASHAGNETHAAGLHLIGRFIGRDQIITSAVLDSVVAA